MGWPPAATRLRPRPPWPLAVAVYPPADGLAPPLPPPFPPPFPAAADSVGLSAPPPADDADAAEPSPESGIMASMVGTVFVMTKMSLLLLQQPEPLPSSQQ